MFAMTTCVLQPYTDQYKRQGEINGKGNHMGSLAIVRNGLKEVCKHRPCRSRKSKALSECSLGVIIMVSLL